MTHERGHAALAFEEVEALANSLGWTIEPVTHAEGGLIEYRLSQEDEQGNVSSEGYNTLQDLQIYLESARLARTGQQIPLLGGLGRRGKALLTGSLPGVGGLGARGKALFGVQDQQPTTSFQPQPIGDPEYTRLQALAEYLGIDLTFDKKEARYVLSGEENGERYEVFVDDLTGDDDSVEAFLEQEERSQRSYGNGTDPSIVPDQRRGEEPPIEAPELFEELMKYSWKTARELVLSSPAAFAREMATYRELFAKTQETDEPPYDPETKEFDGHKFVRFEPDGPWVRLPQTADTGVVRKIRPAPQDWTIHMPGIPIRDAYTEVRDEDGNVVGYRPNEEFFDEYRSRLFGGQSVDDLLDKAIREGNQEEIDRLTKAIQDLKRLDPGFMLEQEKFGVQQRQFGLQQRQFEAQQRQFEAQQRQLGLTRERQREATEFARERQREATEFAREQALFDRRQRETQTALDVQKAAIELAQSPGDWLTWWHMTQGGPDMPQVDAEQMRQFGINRFRDTLFAPRPDGGYGPQPEMPATDPEDEAEWDAVVAKLVDDARQAEAATPIQPPAVLTQAQADQVKLRGGFRDIETTLEGAGLSGEHPAVKSIQASKEAQFPSLGKALLLRGAVAEKEAQQVARAAQRAASAEKKRINQLALGVV